MSNMKPIWIGGNWKCNGTKESITKLAETLNELKFDAEKIEVVLFPPSLYTTHASALLDSKYSIGVQNVSQAKDGAFTGELSVNMLLDSGVVSALVGHSERRTLFGDTDEVVADKVKVLQDTPIQAVVCIGESLAERELNKVLEVITRQVDGFLGNVKDWSKIVIAYEPVWAIGTGKVATSEQVVEAHKMIRDYLREKVGEVADTVRIVYGGSVNESNCKELINCVGVDGFLVGGASLKPSFCDIVKSTE